MMFNWRVAWMMAGLMVLTRAQLMPAAPQEFLPAPTPLGVPLPKETLEDGGGLPPPRAVSKMMRIEEEKSSLINAYSTVCALLPPTTPSITLTASQVHDVIEALGNMADLCLSLEHAQLLLHVNGIPHLNHILHALQPSTAAPFQNDICSLSGKEEILQMTSILIGSAAQNHPEIAREMITLIDPLTAIAGQQTHCPICVHRALYALTAIVRHVDGDHAVLVERIHPLLDSLLSDDSAHAQRAIRLLEAVASRQYELPARWCSAIAHAIASQRLLRSDALKAALAIVDNQDGRCGAFVLVPEVITVLRGHQTDVDDDHEGVIVARLLQQYETQLANDTTAENHPIV